MSLAIQEFTNAGRAMLGRAQNGENLTITKIVVGSGLANVPADLWPLTALTVHEMDVAISAKRDYGNGTLLVEGSFRSDQAPHAFSMREVGIMAHIASEADALYSLANCFAVPPSYIDPAAPTMETFKIKLVIDRIPSANLVVQIGPSENVLGENMLDDSLGPGVYKDAAGNVLRFKRLIAGSHIALTEDANEDSITIGVKTITANLDLYVPATYPGITDPTKLFPTIQAALDSVADLLIPPDKFVTVHVYSGHFTQAAPINVTHPNASQIKIVGLDVVALAVTGNVAVSGTLPNVDVILNVSSVTGIAVNDVVYLHDAPHPQLEACGIVMSVRPTPTPNMTVRFQIRNTLPPASNAALATTKLLWFPTQEIGTIATGTSLFNCMTGLGLLKNFGIRSTNQLGAAVSLYGKGALELVAVCNFEYGFQANDTVNLVPVCAANGCGIGINVGPAATFQVQAPTAWKRVSWSGCSTYGMWIVGGSYTGGSGTYTYICSNVTGVRADTKALFLNGFQPGSTGGIAVVCNDRGLVAEMLSAILTALTAQNTVGANITWDALAQTGSQIGIVHNVNNTGKYSVDGVTQGHKVLGPDGGYINIQTP